jgi:hypothetical protein
VQKVSYVSAKRRLRHERSVSVLAVVKASDGGPLTQHRQGKEELWVRSKLSFAKRRAADSDYELRAHAPETPIATA